MNTYHVEHLTGRRGEYWSTARLSVPDLKLRMGLVNLLDRWDNLLGLQQTDDRIDRRKRLQSARRKLPKQQYPWTFPMSRQLAMLDKTVGNAISACLNHWERPNMRGKELGHQVQQWFDSNKNSLTAKNYDNLFEWICAMKIARDASNCGWEIHKTRDNTDRAKYGDFLLKNERIWLRISKGKPKDGFNQALKPDDQEKNCIIDKVVLIAQRHGLNASGFEPDVVLTFFHEENPKKVVTFLADAKNNQTDDGRNYLRSQINKAVTYVYAYEKILNLTPKCTLLFRQRALHGDRLEQELKIIKNREKEDSIDDVLCINHDVFKPDSTTHWFELIEEKARNQLKKAGSSAPTLQANMSD